MRFQVPNSPQSSGGPEKSPRELISLHRATLGAAGPEAEAARGALLSLSGKECAAFGNSLALSLQRNPRRKGLAQSAMAAAAVLDPVVPRTSAELGYKTLASARRNEDWVLCVHAICHLITGSVDNIRNDAAKVIAYAEAFSMLVGKVSEKELNSHRSIFHNQSAMQSLLPNVEDFFRLLESTRRWELAKVWCPLLGTLFDLDRETPRTRSEAETDARIAFRSLSASLLKAPKERRSKEILREDVKGILQDALIASHEKRHEAAEELLVLGMRTLGSSDPSFFFSATKRPFLFW